MDNEDVGVQMDYLECAYETRYYVIDKVNGQINAIHEDNLELTEFKDWFSPFDLDELERKVCRLVDRNKYEDDLPEPQDILQGHDSDSNSRSHNLDKLTGMGFDENNYSPIPPVWNAASQKGAAQPTSTPKPLIDTNMNTSDPTHNRGKVKIINSFATNQEQMETVAKPSKGGKVHKLGFKLILAPALKEIQVGCKYDAPPMEVQTISGKIVLRMFSAQDAELGLTLQKCAMYPPKQAWATPYVFIVVVPTTYQTGDTTDLITTKRNQGQHLGTSGNMDQVKFTIGLDNHR